MRNPKELFHYIRRKRNIRDAIDPLSNDSGTTNDNKETPSLLNKYFDSVYTIEKKNQIHHQHKTDFQGPKLKKKSLQDILSYEVFKYLEKLTGLDALSLRILIEVSRQIVCPCNTNLQKRDRKCVSRDKIVKHFSL